MKVSKAFLGEDTSPKKMQTYDTDLPSDETGISRKEYNYSMGPLWLGSNRVDIINFRGISGPSENGPNLIFRANVIMVFHDEYVCVCSSQVKAVMTAIKVSFSPQTALSLR